MNQITLPAKFIALTAFMCVFVIPVFGDACQIGHGVSCGFIYKGGVYSTVQYPGADYTSFRGISNSGQLVGYSYVGPTRQPFTYSAGLFTPLNLPEGYIPSRINADDQIVGFYNNFRDGFLYSEGVLSTIDYPGASSTEAEGINDSGQIVGTYSELHSGGGFLYSGGEFSSIQYPGAISTEALDINNSGEIVGIYSLTGGVTQGFLDDNGVFTSIEYPGAYQTFALGMNDSGQVVGYYDDISGGYHGFLYDGGVFTTIDVPVGSGWGALTTPYDIEDSGQIVGQVDFFKTPEPSALLLLLAGLTGVAGRRFLNKRVCKLAGVPNGVR